LSPRRPALLQWLAVEKGMTANQAAHLVPLDGKGNLVAAPTIRTVERAPGQTQEYKYAPTYDLTLQMFKQLEKDGVVVRSKEISRREDKVNHNAPFIWSLKGVDMNINPDNRDHELDCVDFLVSLVTALRPETDRLTHWDYKWSDEELEVYAVKNKIYFDRRFILDGYQYFLEVDNGTKSLKAIREQLERYVALSNAFPKERFTVLYTTQKYRSVSAEARLKSVMKILTDLRRGNQFLVALHAHATTNPLAGIWRSPLAPDRLTALSDLD